MILTPVTAQPGEVGDGRSTPWAVDHPGVAALICSLVAVVGIVLVVGWLLTQDPAVPQPDILASLRHVVPIVGGAPMVLLGLPAALAFAGASCVTGRELWGGVTGGFISVVLALVAVVVVLPGGGLAL